VSFESLTNLDLTDVVNAGDTKGVNMVIDALILNMIINAQDGRGMTPLHLASKKGFLDVALNLLHRGASLSLRDAMGWTPLFWAVMEGHTDLVKLFISRGASVFEVDDSSATLLHFASMEGHAHIVKMLLELELPVAAQDKVSTLPDTARHYTLEDCPFSQLSLSPAHCTLHPAS
jgi:ankyrin repeat protein